MKYLASRTVLFTTNLRLKNISGYVDLDPEIVGNPQGGKKAKIPLNSNDKLYSVIRDLNFSVLGPFLNKKAKEIDEYYRVDDVFVILTGVSKGMVLKPFLKSEIS